MMMRPQKRPKSLWFTRSRHNAWSIVRLARSEPRTQFRLRIIDRRPRIDDHGDAIVPNREMLSVRMAMCRGLQVAELRKIPAEPPKSRFGQAHPCLWINPMVRQFANVQRGTTPRFGNELGRRTQPELVSRL